MTEAIAQNIAGIFRLIRFCEICRKLNVLRRYPFFVRFSDPFLPLDLDLRPLAEIKKGWANRTVRCGRL